MNILPGIFIPYFLLLKDFSHGNFEKYWIRLDELAARGQSKPKKNFFLVDGDISQHKIIINNNNKIIKEH
jgi:hypothetical protein